jgi:hypothetical protein
MEQIRTFTGGLNTDDSVEILSPDDYQFAANFISGRSQASQRGAIENVRGTTVVNTGSFLDTNSKFIGGIRSVTDDVHFLCFYNTDPDKNCVLELNKDVVTNVITWSGLNFSPLKEHRINGGGIAGDLIFLTDNFNKPRCIHRTRHAVTPPVKEEEILVIHRGPTLPPTFEKLFYGDELGSYTESSTTTTTLSVTTTIDPSLPQRGNIVINGNVYTYNSFSSNTFAGVSPSPVGETGTVKVHEYILANLINDFSFQYAYHYEYYDNQISVLSPYSSLCTRSVIQEDYKKVRVTIPADEEIPVKVKEIVISARVNNTGSFFEIGRLKRSAGVFDVLYFDFYNNTNGNLLDPFLSQPYSLVPRRAGSMSLSKSRLWMGNILEGYDTPEDVDLEYGIEVAESATPSTYSVYTLVKKTYEALGNGPPWKWILISTETVVWDTSFQYIIKRDGVIDVVEYTPTWGTGDAPLSRHSGFTNIPQSDYTSQTPPPSPHAGGEQYYTYTYVLTQADVLVNFNPLLSDLEGTKTFPSDSSYKLGILYSDSEGQKCGVLTKESLQIDTPDRKVNSIKINWSLSTHDNIPSWADTFSIVLTKNLKKSWFVENYSIDVHYYRVKSDSSEDIYHGDGSNLYKNYPYVRVNIKNFPLNGLSYSFVEGDRILLKQVGTSTKYDLDLVIKSFDGEYLLCERGDMEVPLTELAYNEIEIYRPITTGGADVVFYEIGHTYKIIQTSTTPLFSVTSGVIEGDTVITGREVYVQNTEVEKTDTSAAFKTISLDNNSIWNTDIGRPFIQTPVGEVLKSAYFRHSATFIAGTKINGLSDFDSGDEGNIPVESGTIQRLQSTNKEATEGDVLLAVSNSDTYSIYIDEARLTTGTSSFLIGATKVVGDVRKQKSGFGTLHPESVHEEDGYVYFFDKLSRSFCRYATNGIFPISEYKAVTHFEDQAALNSEDDEVVTGYDPFYKILFVTFTNAATNTRKTIGWSLVKERWISFFDFAPEGYVVGSNSMYSIKGGVLYKHNDTVNNNRFYGVDFDSMVELSFNDGPDFVKEWLSLGVGCSPNLYAFNGVDQKVITNGLKTDVYNRHNQTTDILWDEFEVNENMVYGEIRGDKNTGGVLDGDTMYSNTAQCRITMLSGINKYLLYAKVGFEVSRGHEL